GVDFFNDILTPAQFVFPVANPAMFVSSFDFAGGYVPASDGNLWAFTTDNGSGQWHWYNQGKPSGCTPYGDPSNSWDNAGDVAGFVTCGNGQTVGRYVLDRHTSTYFWVVENASAPLNTASYAFQLNGGVGMASVFHLNTGEVDEYGIS